MHVLERAAETTSIAQFLEIAFPPERRERITLPEGWVS